MCDRGVTFRGDEAFVCERVCLSARPEVVEDDEEWLLAGWAGRARDERRGGMMDASTWNCRLLLTSFCAWSSEVKGSTERGRRSWSESAESETVVTDNLV